jgi:hypothetical protein
MSEPKKTAEPSGASGGSLANRTSQRNDEAADIMAQGIAEMLRIAAEPAWIPVTERLPDKNVNVIVFIPAAAEQTYIASLDDGGMWFSSDPTADAYSLGEDGAPTHWMPLPAPPTASK